MLQDALQYAAMGWHVFPCKPRDKRPATRNGFYNATTDEATIRAWWTENPEYNIALATGAMSGVMAIDIDPRHHGDEIIDAALDDNDELPKGYLESQTGGGGRHLIFAYNGEPSVVLANGLEIKSDGAYIILPPSVHPDGPTYNWELSSSPFEDGDEDIAHGASMDSGVDSDDGPESPCAVQESAAA
jgi:hypothetical protein